MDDGKGTGVRVWRVCVAVSLSLERRGGSDDGAAAAAALLSGPLADACFPSDEDPLEGRLIQHILQRGIQGPSSTAAAAAAAADAAEVTMPRCCVGGSG